MSSPQGQDTKPLKSTFHIPKDEELELLKKLIGISDEEMLRMHVREIQEKAYKIFPYTCIRTCDFLNTRVGSMPWYEEILNLGKERPEAIYLELGCCFGTDVRRVASDGYPVGNIIASDLCAEFWELGHHLYKSTPETFPVLFLQGDLFNSAFISPEIPPLSTSFSIPTSTGPSLKSITTLIPLQNHVSVIHMSAVFHLFTSEKQIQLAHLVGSLLSPLPGSMILGSHRGVPDLEKNKNGRLIKNMRGVTIFSHSPTSWKKLWIGEGGVFRKGDAIIQSVVERFIIPMVDEQSGVCGVDKGLEEDWWHIWRVLRI